MSSSQCTILLLDDEEAIRESFEWYFEDHGWETISARTGEEALKLIEKSPPDCAIVDIRLPGIDGDTFLERAQALSPLMACVICTGSPDYGASEGVSKMMQVSDVIFHKPIRDISTIKDELMLLMEKLSKRE